MNALVPVHEIQMMAAAVAKSGLFGIRTPDQAMALMLIAQAEGLHPAIAARDYHVINGKPTLKADAMLARFQQAGGTLKWEKYTDTVCSAIVSHPQGGSVTIEWTIDMAVRAQLTKNPTWKSYPRQMLRARVISEGIRTVFPGVAVGVYTQEEAEDFAAAKAPAANKVAAKEVNAGPVIDGEFHEIVEPDMAELFEKIAKAKTTEDLEALRPTIRQLSEENRQLVFTSARKRSEEIRAQEALDDGLAKEAGDA